MSDEKKPEDYFDICAEYFVFAAVIIFAVFVGFIMGRNS